MTTTKIEWTQGPDGAAGKTWNPLRGCSLASAGCTNCYAMKLAHRFAGKGQPYEGLTVLGKHGPRWTGEVRFVPEMLDAPLHWRKPARVFVNSMADLFHDDVTNEQIAAVFGVMAAAPRHTFQVLTKRAARMAAYVRGAEERAREAGENLAGEKGWCHANEGESWPLKNVWLGASVENQETADERIPHLLATPAAVHFLSCEPLLGPIDLAPWLDPGQNGRESGGPEGWVAGPRPDWVIVGSESGPGARPMATEWARGIVDACMAAGVAVFVKQIATAAGKAAGEPKGGNPAHWPPGTWPRQFPQVAP